MMERKLEEHIPEDRASFNRLFAKMDAVDHKADALALKLDAHKTQLDIIRGQWKMVGAVVGMIFGAVTAWFLG